ncbi:histidine triad nucleotide-binding protein [Roseicella aquatilis]|uniref:Histidine triad nucleotide-binding protein n=1 Tax=Roseicella aquatilis TaxID=2527868 RepID=A0A4R4DQA9_9PROT|nr:histidine triad nucleotide-binding protein [Roseicella aquatilis]TCZ64041.1 histidine triad nucleotide-binding protein [Roseicella aquatilis]
MSVTGLPPYDEANIFARILRGEIPCKRVAEDDHALAFHDIHPQAPTHILVIPKGSWVSAADFHAGASAEAIAGFWRMVAAVAKAQGLEAGGYRILSNMGADGGQEVPHFHVHIFGGRRLGRMVPPAPAG